VQNKTPIGNDCRDGVAYIRVKSRSHGHEAICVVRHVQLGHTKTQLGSVKERANLVCIVETLLHNGNLSSRAQLYK